MRDCEGLGYVLLSSFSFLSFFILYFHFISWFWFESVHFSSTLIVLKSNVEDESLPPMLLYLYLGRY